MNSAFGSPLLLTQAMVTKKDTFAESMMLKAGKEGPSKQATLNSNPKFVLDR